MTNNSNEDIPNEDSQDVQLDASNLFEANRFPGLDVVEDQSRVTYGLRAGLNGYESGNVEFFVGQNYRFDDEDIPFQSGSGLNAQSSDVVGYVRGDIGSRYSMQYRFQLNNETLASERHEFDASADWNRFRLSSNYLYAEPIEGTEITESREQLSATAQYYFNKNWRLLTQAQYDLGSDPGLRKGSLGLDYFGQCVSWSLLGKKTLTDDSSGDSDTEVVFRIGLKNISEFMRSGLRDEGNSP
jgi:LPS-assembly protein